MRYSSAGRLGRDRREAAGLLLPDEDDAEDELDEEPLDEEPLDDELLDDELLEEDGLLEPSDPPPLPDDARESVR